MLVCSVVLRPQRHAIASDIAEAAVALDSPSLGAIYATLTDNPGNALDILGAFVGQTLTEATSANTVLDAVAVKPASAIVETAAAASVQGATITTAPAFATFDGTATNVTLSNGNLTATHSVAVTDSGVRSSALKSTGKYYFEITLGTGSGIWDNLGVAKSDATYGNLTTDHTKGTIIYRDGPYVFTSDSFTFVYGGGNLVSGNVISVAADLDNLKLWFRRNGGAWNSGGDPTVGASFGGCIMAAGSYSPYVCFGGSPAGNIGDNMTANFGASAFTYAVPSGYTSGWPS